MPSSDESPRAADTPNDDARVIGDVPECPTEYELLEAIGHGGMGVVYRARDRALDREVALKFLHRGYAVDSPAATRFLEEARITGRLQHPGIPPIHQVGTLPDGRPYLAMKFIRGRTLAELLEREGPHATRWLRVFETISQAVGDAHAQGVVHRDLKPANVMVGDHGEVQVMDWGLAKVLGIAPTPPARPVASPAETIDLRPDMQPLGKSDGSLTQIGSVLGTPQFMPPEQAAGEIDKISERTDVFGLGAVLCVLLTGRPPFDGSSAETTRLNAVRGRTEAAFARLDACDAEADVVALCKRCLAFEPVDRPAHGVAVADAVAAIRRHVEERAKRADVERATSDVRRREGDRRRHMLLAAGGVAATILGLGVVGTSIGLYRAVQARRDEAAQRTLVDAARTKAQARLESAIALVDRLTVRVNGTQWATNPDLQDERRRILEDAVGLIAELAGDDSTDPLVRREVARANHIGGSPDAPFASRFELGFALNMAGTFAMNGNQFPLAAKHFREAGAIFHELGSRTAPTARDAERLLQTRAMAAIQLGLVEAIQTRDPDEGRRIAAELRQAIAILDGLLAIQPRTATYQIQKIQGLSVLAQLTRAFGPREEYRANLRSLRAVEDALTENRPAFGWVRRIGLNVFGVAMVEDARAGRADAVAEAERLLDVVGAAGQFPAGSPQVTLIKYNAACVFALASSKADDIVRRAALADRAMKLLEELKVERYFRNPNNSRSLATDADLAPLHDRAGWRRFVTAVAKEHLAAARQNIPPESAEWASQLANVGKVLVDWDDCGAAEPILRECLTIREKLAPEAWTTFNAKALLGGALMGLSKHAEAELLLKAGYEGLVHTRDSIPASSSHVLFEAGHRLAALYDATGRTEQAVAIRASLPREPAPTPNEK